MKKESIFSGMRAIVLGLGVSAFALGCSGGDSEDAAPTDDAPTSVEDTEAPSEDAAPAEDASADEAAAPAEEAAPAMSVASGLAGKITITGDVPAATVISTEGDPNCAMAHDGDVVSEKYVVSADGGLANAFVYVVNPPEGDYPPSAEAAVLDQIGCMYTPRIVGVQVGQELSIVNSDPTTHNVRASARKNKAINYGQPKDSKPRTKKFKKEELAIKLKCDIHPWMTGYVFAMSTPFFAVSDDSGAFSIAGLSAGEYEVIAWHESFLKGEQKGTVTVDADGNGSIDFTFAL